MNDKKICFIICSNNEMLLTECFAYIKRLYVPEGFDIEALVITEAKSMTAGYNEGMHKTDAKYKIYMHQDVFIINRFFLINVINIFNKDTNIGAMGLVGYKSLMNACCMWLNPRYGIGNVFGSERRNYVDYGLTEQIIDCGDVINNVLVVDGLLIATSVDISWDEEFDGWDFYDASQCIRFQEAGFNVVVPQQSFPWFVHDDGKHLTMWNYDKYRKQFINKYGAELVKLTEQIEKQGDYRM